ncbi:hypothetical protein [Halalkalicoccus subterraneus]|uniref:hypothetical protein n=1 Tax=Halalkalicoccus subterraneus TaxID=2675002 RepID=UPI000EFD873C|nr:hypothetical protein [Halalkalicoccus subterraneus]
MKSIESLPLRRIIWIILLAYFVLFSSARIVESGTSPWGWVVAFAIGTAVLVGPVMWAIRDRFSEKRRESLGYVAWVIALIFISVILGLGLIFENLLLIMDVGALGGIIGYIVVLVLERMVLPERLQGTSQ